MLRANSSPQRQTQCEARDVRLHRLRSVWHAEPFDDEKTDGRHMNASVIGGEPRRTLDQRRLFVAVACAITFSGVAKVDAQPQRVGVDGDVLLTSTSNDRGESLEYRVSARRLARLWAA